jgi:hypothetical protein
VDAVTLRISLLTLAALVAISGTSHARTSDSAVLMNEATTPYGVLARVIHPGDGRVRVSDEGPGIAVSLSGGSGPSPAGSFGIRFAAPLGSPLREGVYTNAGPIHDLAPGRPGVEVRHPDEVCPEPGGRFEVRRLRRDRRRRIRRFWVVFQLDCEGALFGEVRFRMPDPSRGAAVLPTILRWPPTEHGRVGPTRPVWVIAGARGRRLGAVSVTGRERASFSIETDECSGNELGPGESCRVWLRFAPPGAGSRRAVLRVPDTRGRTYGARLQGFAYGGVTRVLLDSEPGEFIGGGQDWIFTPANARLSAVGSRRVIQYFVTTDADDENWYGSFAAAPGDILAPGRYTGAARYPFNGDRPGLEVTGMNRSCNEISGEFTVTEFRHDSDGLLRSFAADFAQRCDHSPQLLRGTFAFRAGDRTRLPGWMRPTLFRRR